MKLIVKKTDTVKITVYCYEVDGEVEASHQKSDVPQDVDVVEQVEFTFRKPNYGDSNIIMRSSKFKIDGEDTSLDATNFQQIILTTLLIDFDLKDEDGKKVPFTNSNVLSLVPSIARAAVSAILEKVKI